jgi:hypothetical protein
MEFEIGDKVKTITGLYMSGAWREAGLKGKVLESPNEYGSLTVKFKGMDEHRLIRPEYVVLRKKAAETDTEAVAEEESEDLKAYYDAHRFVEDESKITPGATVVVVGDVETNDNYIEELTTGVIKSVDTTDRTAVVKLTDEGADFHYTDTLKFDEFTVVDAASEAGYSPEVVEALNQILANIEEIKELLTTKPQNEFHIYTSEASFVTPEKEEEPAPEPVFKKAKEVKVGDMLYTDEGAYDKVHRVETKSSGYTSLFGAFGNKIVQVPSARPLRVLEEVS